MANYKYEHVANTIRKKITDGIYEPGSKLPSIQTLADELSLNTDTIIRAYKFLESEHLVYSVAKSGYYAVKSTNSVEETTLVIDMLSTNPANEINPYKDFYHCMEKAISLYEHKLFVYSPVKGLPELVGIIREHIADYQIFAKEEDIFITSGAQQALFILASMEFPDGRDTVLVEQPTYHVMLEAINANKTPVTGIRRTINGLDLSELERIFSQKRIKFLYLMPRFQNPTGYSYNNAQKKEILRLAGKYQVYIVEDDYLADLETDRKSDPFAAFDVDNKVIYVKSFSKTLLPGLRLGMAIIPKQLQEEFIIMKNAIDLNSSVFSQGALEIYLRSSMFLAHVKRTKAYYKKKMDILRHECEKELADIANCFVPSTGIFAYIEPEKMRAESIIGNLAKIGLKAMSTNLSYLKNFDHPEGIRLCTCNVDAGSIPRAVQILKKTLRH
jgi:DNA-binding transcriptional MocR family regulator